jgi:hypothetical protein
MRTTTQSIFFALTASAAASLCIVTAAGPAAARGVTDPMTIAPKVSSGGSVSADKKVCMKAEALTGSRMRREVCKTKAEWEAEGFTVSSRSKAKAAEQR